MKRTIACILFVVLALSLLATSFVTGVTGAPLRDDYMISHLITIPEGSTHPDYDGDYITSDETIPLHLGWTVNLPINTCAIATRFAYKDDTVNHWGALKPAPGGAFAILARTQVVDVWSDTAGIVPVTTTTTPSMRLDISSPGYVYIQITGYWLCELYTRPTLEP